MWSYFRQTRWFQFRLSTLLLAFVPVGFGSLWLGDYLETRPVDVVDYSEEVLQKHLDGGRKVLVFATIPFS